MLDECLIQATGHFWHAAQDAGKRAALLVHNSTRSVHDIVRVLATYKGGEPGFIVVYVGLTALCANWLALFALALLICGLWLKARAEEQSLIEELGTTAYGDNRARTPMLVPNFLSRS